MRYFLDLIPQLRNHVRKFVDLLREIRELFVIPDDKH